jgi:hypothetical protein
MKFTFELGYYDNNIYKWHYEMENNNNKTVAHMTYQLTVLV